MKLITLVATMLVTDSDAGSMALQAISMLSRPSAKGQAARLKGVDDAVKINTLGSEVGEVSIMSISEAPVIVAEVEKTQTVVATDFLGVPEILEK